MSNVPQRTTSWFQYLQYKEGRDSTTDVRNVLLVISALIAAVTFQAGVNPPGGVWQDAGRGHEAGRAIYASHSGAYYVFLMSNTLAFSASLLILISLTHKFPFRFEVYTAAISMAVTYGSAVFAVTPHDHVRFRYILLTGAVPFVIRICVDIYRQYKDEK